MFIENKYLKIYYQIIDRAKSFNFSSRAAAKKHHGYVERHHVIPKSLGGSDTADNLVYLTAREHFICHMLLIRFTDGADKRKMTFALNKMTRKSKNQNRHIPKSYQYEKIRIDFSNSISAEMAGKKKKPHSQEHKEALSKKTKGIPKTEGAIKNMIASWDDVDRKQELSNRNTELQTLKKLWEDDEFRNKMTNDVSERQRQRLSDPKVLAESLEKLNVKKTCESCNITTNAGNYKRWHGVNCKKVKVLGLT
jgi:hypothetical protein